MSYAIGTYPIMTIQDSYLAGSPCPSPSTETFSASAPSKQCPSTNCISNTTFPRVRGASLGKELQLPSCLYLIRRPTDWQMLEYVHMGRRSAQEADRLYKLIGTNLDIEEATCVAVASNDVSGLIGDVLARLR